MDYLYLLIRAFMVGVAASVTVGPVAILCIQRTLSKSRRSGIISGLGVASADTVMAMFSYVFYSVLRPSIEEYSHIIRVVGGILVVMVGTYIFFQNTAQRIRKNRAGNSSGWQDYASIFGLTITSFMMVVPYILAFFAVFKIPTYDPACSDSFLRSVLIISGFFVGSASWWTGVASTINLFRKRFRPRHLVVINHVSGVLIVFLGIYTILSTFINIIPDGVL